MRDVHVSVPSLSSIEWLQWKPVRDRFEAAWRAGQRPKLGRYLPPAPQVWQILDLAAMDLELRLKAGENAGADDYVRRYPVLGQHPAALAELAKVEREERGHKAEPAREAKNGQRSPSRRNAAMDETIPEKFGRYRIQRQLGKGGMGSVYLAYDTQLERRVALKVPHLAEEHREQTLQRFYHEVRAAAALSHPNICAVYDVGLQDNVPYLAMAYIDGETLAARLKSPLPQREAGEIVYKLALAMQEAHKHGVIHRDLKPSNVMIDRRGEPVVMDFGLAWQSQRQSARITKLGVFMGTPAYMPPEQIRGEIDVMGPGCDIYSLGVVLYESLAGRLPFEGSFEAVVAQVLDQQPKPPSAHRSGVDPRLDTICRRAMRKIPGERYKTMLDFAEAVADFLKPPIPGGVTPIPEAIPVPEVIPVPDDPAPVRIPRGTRKGKGGSRGPHAKRGAVFCGLVFVGLVLAGCGWYFLPPTSGNGDDARVLPPGVGLPVGAREDFMRVTNFTSRLRTQSEFTSSDGMSGDMRCKVYVIDFAAGHEYAIDLETAEFDTFLSLEYLRGGIIASAVGAAPRSRSAHIVWTAPDSGTYRIAVCSSDGRLGRYTLSVRDASLDK